MITSFLFVIAPLQAVHTAHLNFSGTPARTALLTRSQSLRGESVECIDSFIFNAIFDQNVLRSPAKERLHLSHAKDMASFPSREMFCHICCHLVSGSASGGSTASCSASASVDTVRGRPSSRALSATRDHVADKPESPEETLSRKRCLRDLRLGAWPSPSASAISASYGSSFCRILCLQVHKKPGKCPQTNSKPTTGLSFKHGLVNKSDIWIRLVMGYFWPLCFVTLYGMLPWPWLGTALIP